LSDADFDQRYRHAGLPKMPGVSRKTIKSLSDHLSPSLNIMAPPQDESKHDGEGGAVVVVSDAVQPPGIAGADHIPLRLKITAVLLVSAIGFGAHWSSGVTGAMKSTLKKVYLTFGWTTWITL
jgi:hypothetical protein